jgi:hypothetical protein
MTDYVTGINGLQNLLNFFGAERRRFAFSAGEFGRFEDEANPSKVRSWIGSVGPVAF